MKIFDNFLKAIVKIASTLLMILVSSIVLLMINELFLRNIIGKSFSGMTELAGLFFLWMAFLGVIVLFDQNSLITLDVFVKNAKDKKKKIISLLHQIVSFCLGIAICLGYIELYPFVSTTFYSSMPHISKGWQYLPLLICGLFIVLKSTNNFLKIILIKEEPSKC